MARNSIEDILQDCLERLQSGSTVDECLASYPDHAEELQSLLSTSASIASVPLTPDPAYRNAAQFRFQGAVRHHLVQQREQGRLNNHWWQRFSVSMWTRTWAGTAAGLLLTVGLGGGVAFASSGAMPDDILYPVKRVTERARLAVTPSETSRALYYLELVERRTQELTAMAEAGKVDHVNRVSRDLNHYLQLARAEVGLGNLDGEPGSFATQASAASPAEEAASEMAASDDSAEISSFSVTSDAALDSTTSQVQRAVAVSDLPIDPRLRAYLEAEGNAALKHMVALTVMEQDAPRETRAMIGRAIQNFAAIQRSNTTSIAENPLDHILAIQGVATVRNNTLILGGRRVVFTSNAQRNGQAKTGDEVIILGYIRPGTNVLMGTKMLIVDHDQEQTSFVVIRGPIQAIGDGALVIPGYRVNRERGTTISGDVQPGNWVEIKGRVTGPGAILAEQVHVQATDPLD